MIFSVMAATTPTGPSDPGGWTFLPLVELPGIALVGGVVIAFLLHRKARTLPPWSSALAVPLGAVGAEIAYIGITRGVSDISLSEPGSLYALVALSIGGGVLLGLSLGRNAMPAMVAGAVLLVLPLLGGPFAVSTNASIEGFLVVGGVWGVIAIVLGYVVGRRDSSDQPPEGSNSVGE